MTESQAVDAAAPLRQFAGSSEPRWAVVAGSGLADLEKAFSSTDEILYRDVPGFNSPSVQGHPGRLVLASAGDVPIWLCLGRPHFYESGSMGPIVTFTRSLAHAGVQSLLLTNAAGAVSPDLHIRDLMVVRDHVFLPGLAGHHPLIGPNDPLGPRFPSGSSTYDKELCCVLVDIISEAGLRVREGVYAMVAGPGYETPAETRMLAVLGADAVGMSTVPEAIVARHAGLRLAAVSVITNQIGTAAEPATTHQSVTQVSADVAPRLGAALHHLITSQPTPLS